MVDKTKKSIFFTLIISAVFLFPKLCFNIDTYGQSPMIMNDTGIQQHAKHIFDNLIISQHIPLTGNLVNGDYLLLMDLTPFATSVEGHSHIALKIPCSKDGSPKTTIVTGIGPNLKSLDIGKAINNGTLDGKIFNLSSEGLYCLYHTQLPKGITDIALVNKSNETLNFDRGGYSVTISVHGSAIQHLAANETMAVQ